MSGKARDPRGSTKWQKLRRILYERDRKANAPCWICGQPIDYRAAPGTPDSWEPDHALPVSTHPELAYDPGNVMPSHCSCNRSRGNASKPAGIGRPTRRW